jgi:hypothetical protein
MKTVPLVLLSSLAGSAAIANAAAPVRSFVGQHCIECHGPKKAKGDLRLDELGVDFSDNTTRRKWQDVLEKLEAGEMPPKKQPRPPEHDVMAASEWIVTQLAEQRRAAGRVVMRRLNRTEYENTVRDLLGVNSSLKDMLPLDGAAGGFDNVGDAMHTSSFLMDKYLEAADIALSQAIANRPQPKLLHERYLPAESHQVKSTTERVFRKSDDGRLTAFSSSAWQAVGVTKFYPGERGRYRFRMSASATQSAGKPVVFRVWAGSGGMGGAKGHLVGYFDAPPEKAKVFEWEDYMEPRTSISILPYGLASSQTVHKIGADAYDGPGLVIDWVEAEGPINETWPPESHRRIFGDLPQTKAPVFNQSDRVEVSSNDPHADAGRILHAFARRAFRRTVSDADVSPFLALVDAKLAERRSFEQAMRAGLAAIMTSPDFLFFKESPGTLDDFALASRLSYFLWSTMPDEELLAAAEQHKLSRPEERHAQVERMLRHPKAAAFTENFTGQWLGLRDIDFTIPSHILYPEFDDMLKFSMLREVELFFSEVLAQDLPLTNFIASDFTMLNGRLAKHYGVPGPGGWEFSKVTLPRESHRGGLLTMAAVLKVTANGTTTSPVVRGAWVLDRILGTPPARPPANVPALEPDTRGATTIREQLAKHRQLESCAGCHVKMDPPGFALESFDVIGGWRDHYRTSGNGRPVMLDGKRMPYLQGPAVDPSDALPDGRVFRDSDELKQLLLADKDRIARALASRLAAYATGAITEAGDRPQISAIVARVRERNYGFRSLIHAVVESELFRSK